MSEHEIVVTELGCHIRTWPAPKHLGAGRMLELSLPENGQRAEVYLDPASLSALREMFA